MSRSMAPLQGSRLQPQLSRFVVPASMLGRLLHVMILGKICSESVSASVVGCLKCVCVCFLLLIVTLITRVPAVCAHQSHTGGGLRGGTQNILKTTRASGPIGGASFCG